MILLKETNTQNDKRQLYKKIIFIIIELVENIIWDMILFRYIFVVCEINYILYILIYTYIIIYYIF